MVRKRKPDAKEVALAETRTLNPHPEAVRDEQFESSEFFDARDLVQVKYEMVRRVRVDGAPVTAAAAAFGFSRPSYYEAAAAVERRRAGWAGAGQAGSAARAQAHRRGDRLCPAAARAGPRHRVGAAGGGDRGPIRDQGAPAIGGAGAGPR